MTGSSGIGSFAGKPLNLESLNSKPQAPLKGLGLQVSGFRLRTEHGIAAARAISQQPTEV